jgi:RNA polymerase sigma factor (sigma-70 family)
MIDDLCQETYLRFYKKLGDNIEENSVRILFGFCRNIYKEFVYKHLKEREINFNDEILYENLLQNNAIEDPVKREQLKLITEVLPKLNPKVRRVIEYRFIYSMSRREVAELLEMKERDVLKYQQRGIQYIKTFLNE